MILMWLLRQLNGGNEWSIQWIVLEALISTWTRMKVNLISHKYKLPLLTEGNWPRYVFSHKVTTVIDTQPENNSIVPPSNSCYFRISPVFRTYLPYPIWDTLSYTPTHSSSLSLWPFILRRILNLAHIWLYLITCSLVPYKSYTPQWLTACIQS